MAKSLPPPDISMTMTPKGAKPAQGEGAQDGQAPVQTTPPTPGTAPPMVRRGLTMVPAETAQEPEAGGRQFLGEAWDFLKGLQVTEPSPEFQQEFEAQWQQG